MANPCPCEAVVHDTPATSVNADSSAIQYLDDESAEDYFNQLLAGFVARGQYPDLTDAYAFNHPKSSFSDLAAGRRSKRPSWATVGKRSEILINKRPSWAQVG